MYASVQKGQVPFSWLFRYCGRAGGLIILLSWLLVVVMELGRQGAPIAANYYQAIPLAIVFAGYAIGWRREVLGGLLAIAGTVGFIVQHVVMFGILPFPGAVSFAVPGVFYLIAHFLDNLCVTLTGVATMNIKSILFPTDFSEYNDAALHYASALAADANATLHIVHVHDTRDLNPAMGDATYLYASAWQHELDVVRRLLDRIRPTSPGVTYEHHCLTGPPEAEIVEFAASHKIDLIVMASHGRGGFSRLLMGSVAEAVMRKSPCPVLIVKQPAAGNEQDQHQITSNSETRLLS